MKTIDGSSRLKIFVLMIISFVMISGCYAYHNYSVYKSIKVVANDTAAIEYGSANYDINELLKEVEGEIVSVKKDIDTSVLGEQEIILEVKKDNIVKDVPVVVSVVDRTAPVIQLNKDTVSVTEGDNIDLQSNILSVNDSIDGDLSYSSDASEDSLNYYTFSYDDLSSVGSHDVIVTAVDKSGNISTASFKVNVQEKPKPVEVARVNSTINVPDNVSGNDIVQIAYKYIGYPYVSGANGPYSFDCSGFVQFVYSQVGKSISRSTSTQILDGVGISYDNVQPGDILSWGYTDGVPTHSALYVGNGMMIHAANPSQGVLLSNVAAWTRGSGTRVISVRRIG